MTEVSLANQELGTVKWFGGFNNKTNRENDFGFIESIFGDDIYVHKSALTDSASLTEGSQVSFSVTPGAKRPQANEVRQFSFEREGAIHLLSRLKRVEHGSRGRAYLAYLEDLEHSYYSSSEDVKSEIAEVLFEDDAGKAVLKGFKNEAGVYRQVLLSMEFADLIRKFPNLDDLPHELIVENEETICRLICEGAITALSSDFIESATRPILYACGLVNLNDNDVLEYRESDLKEYLRSKFLKPDGRNATLYKDIFSDCVQRIGGYKSSPVIWDILSELLLKKYLYERNFNKASQLFESKAGLERKIDCFILYNLAQLLAAGNDLRTTYPVFVQMLWEALASQQVDVEAQADRILSLFPSCGTMKLAVVDESPVENDFDDDEMLDAIFGVSDLARSKKLERKKTKDRFASRDLSCEAVYWAKQKKYLCRGSVCSNPKIEPNLERSYLDFSIYDWFVHLGVEFWNSEDHAVRDFPIKVAGYLNRLREIMPRLRCRSCHELMVPEFKYSRVKCSVYENGQWVEKDMAAAYRNTVFYCNNESCQEHNAKYYINHCLGFQCYDLIDSRDLNVKCDAGRLICKGCGSCCGDHAKSNPVGSCPECGALLQVFEDVSQPPRFGRYSRFVRCSNQHCGFGMTEPGLSRKFYLASCQPVYQSAGETW